MRFVLALLLFLTSALAYETVYDAARIARSLVDDSETSIGTMATTFPSEYPNLPNHPFALQEYYASCHQNGTLTLLFLPISRHSQNILHTDGHAASITITSTRPAARNARVSLLGNVTIFEDTPTVPELQRIKQCYLNIHPDAKWWLPDDDGAAHISYWAFFHPHSVYFVGGFGDKHYIGWVPLDLYHDSGLQGTSSQKGPSEQQRVLGTRPSPSKFEP
ncbi:pyridoxamine 5'-phosphate oxidase-domain-containing protein [Flagelloscypha sp. PMI_526]|nr:pyridoxamine 5'-phosphate oxidase-domain-containing protein [Flagelloscypha sp. PMI_526]